MRGFVSLFFAVALAAHLGPAGAPSLGGAPVCADEIGVGPRLAGPVLFVASLSAPQSESAPERRERSGGTGLRRTVPEVAAGTCQAMVMGAQQRPQAATPPSLLGFLNNPTTAPPLQA